MAPQIELKDNQTIVFIGDSITDADRTEPPYSPLGYGYVHFVVNLLRARHPQLHLNIVNAGVCAHTVRDLKARWDRDCLAHKPDIVSVMIGINDLWRQHVELEKLFEAVYPEEYELTYRWLLSRAREQCDCQFVLMEPFVFCDDPADQLLTALRTYIGIVHKLADEFDAVVVPLQTMIDERIREVTPDKWSADSVHPYLWAHAWIALRWLEVTRL